MKITGENIIAAKPDAVWCGLNDPNVLRQAIPGCESLEQISQNAFKATVTSRIGPITARFLGKVELQDLQPPHGYTLVGSGSAGAMGSAKGAAKVRLSPEGAGTKLSYEIDAEMSGKIAQLGARLVQGTVNVLAGQFFQKFGELVSGAPVEIRPQAARTGAMSAWIWIALAALAALGIGYYVLG